VKGWRNDNEERGGGKSSPEKRQQNQTPELALDYYIIFN